MNKITVVNNEIKTEIDSSMKVAVVDCSELFDVKKITIQIKKDTDLEIEYDSNESKLDLEIILKENINCNLFELRHDNQIKVKYHYVLNESSNLKIVKFYDSSVVRELDIIDLNGKYASIYYELKTIATEEQKYDLLVTHNASNTISNITNHGVTLENGSIHFNVTGLVYNDMVDCSMNQNNKIITFNDKKCKIVPKLLIEENDVVANHSAFIGKFEEDDLFYLKSRGIDQNSAITLLTKGFLLEGRQDERLDKIIEKYWR